MRLSMKYSKASHIFSQYKVAPVNAEFININTRSFITNSNDLGGRPSSALDTLSSGSSRLRKASGANDGQYDRWIWTNGSRRISRTRRGISRTRRGRSSGSAFVFVRVPPTWLQIIEFSEKCVSMSTSTNPANIVPDSASGSC
jgi:hypothetical protein